MTRTSRLLLLPVLGALFACAYAFCSKPTTGTSTADAGPQAAAPKAAGPGFTLVYSAGIVGHLEPCGCSPDQRGGVGRAAATVEKIRAEGRPVLLVDGGDRFFPSPNAPQDEMVASQLKLQARAMADVTRLMHYDAVVLGARDAGAGTSFVQGEKLPPVLDTGETALPGTKTSLVQDVGGVKVGLFAVGGEKTAEQTLKARAAALRSQGARVVILIAYRPFEDAKALLPAAKEAKVDFVLASRADVPETTESAALPDSDPPLFAVAARGEELLRLDVAAGGPAEQPFTKLTGLGEREADLKAMQERIDLMRREIVQSSPNDPMKKLRTDKLLELEAKRARLAEAPPPPLPADRNAFSYAFIPMSPKLEQDKQVRAAIDSYDTTVARQNLDYAKAHPRQCPAKKGEATYVGGETCESCHQDEADFWAKTAHARAYQSLVGRNKQYDTSCIGCHVTGYEKAGGACDIAQTEGRRNVQCESCHGPGSLHVQAAQANKPDAAVKRLIQLQVPEQTCRKCHDPENSPHFNDATYRPQILGPGHPGRTSGK